jgi:DNA-binding LacI/PurR family transcriptional regulator
VSQTLRRAFVTAAEVARRAGVSRSAVSRALRLEPASPKRCASASCTRRSISDTASPACAKSQQRAPNLIGLVGTDLQQPFHAELPSPRRPAALLADGFQCMLLNAANAERGYRRADRPRARVSRLAIVR